MIDFSESTSYGQDRFVNNILNKKKGFFLEIGFVEPQKYNNTYVLEKKLDWRGINIHGVRPRINPYRTNMTLINNWINLQ